MLRRIQPGWLIIDISISCVVTTEASLLVAAPEINHSDAVVINTQYRRLHIIYFIYI